MKSPTERRQELFVYFEECIKKHLDFCCQGHFGFLAKNFKGAQHLPLNALSTLV
jgi:hypothetical protein